jgi:RNA polymerase sigma-70 factor (ECF subfamily)
MQYKQSHEWCEDMVSLGIIKACEAVGTLRDEKVFKTWYWSIVINAARNDLRLPMHKRHIEFKDMRVEATQYTIIMDREHDEIIRNVIAGLPEIQGLVFKLRYVDELSFKEIAEIMDCPYDTAKANFRHAFLRVKPYLIERIINAE